VCEGVVEVVAPGAAEAELTCRCRKELDKFLERPWCLDAAFGSFKPQMSREVGGLLWMV